MPVYDISQPIYPGMPVYKNIMKKQPLIEEQEKEGVRESLLHINTHTGTHLDAPLHMIPEGDSIDKIPAQDLVTPCRVLDLTGRCCLSAQDFRNSGVVAGEFILCRTDNSSRGFPTTDFVYINAEAASYLAALPVKGIGFDALGIEREQRGHPSHKALFQAGVLVLEGLRLESIIAGNYLLVIAPLPLIGTDAAPARAYLLTILK